jgi:biotin transport system substrate-specific component
MKTKKSSALVLSALFAALISAGCFIQIPLPSGVPVVIQDMMAMLSGLLLGPLYGGISAAIFILLGILGLPVFSGKAGLHVILQGPTGGFIAGYFVAAVLGGLVLEIFLPREKKISAKKEFALIFFAAVLATVIVFFFGVMRFKIVTGSSVEKSLALCLLPFLPGNAIKLAVMIFVTKKFRPVVSNYVLK